MKTFSIDAICPGINSITQNPIKIRETHIEPKIAQMLFNQELLGIEENENQRNIWLIRKYMYEDYCYQKSYKYFKDYIKGTSKN